MIDSEIEQFIAQILSDLDYHCSVEDRKAILQRVLASFCPCCGCKVKSKDTNEGESGTLIMVCNHLGVDKEISIRLQSTNGGFRPEMPTNPCGMVENEHPKFIIESLDKIDGDTLCSGDTIRLIPAK